MKFSLLYLKRPVVESRVVEFLAEEGDLHAVLQVEDLVFLVRPVLVCLDPLSLHQPSDHDDDCHVLLHHQLPEPVEHVGLGSLHSKELLVVVRECDQGGVDVGGGRCS